MSIREHLLMAILAILARKVNFIPAVPCRAAFATVVFDGHSLARRSVPPVRQNHVLNGAESGIFLSGNSNVVTDKRHHRGHNRRPEETRLLSETSSRETISSIRPCPLRILNSSTLPDSFRRSVERRVPASREGCQCFRRDSWRLCAHIMVMISFDCITMSDNPLAGRVDRPNDRLEQIFRGQQISTLTIPTNEGSVSLCGWGNG